MALRRISDPTTKYLTTSIVTPTMSRFPGRVNWIKFEKGAKIVEIFPANMGPANYFRQHIVTESRMEEKFQENIQPTISVKKQVVVYGKHEYIVKNVLDLLARADYAGTGYTNLEETLDHIRLSSFDAIIIGGGVDPHDRQQVKDLVNKDYKHAKIVEHYGGPATIIPELKSVLGDK